GVPRLCLGPVVPVPGARARTLPRHRGRVGRGVAARRFDPQARAAVHGPDGARRRRVLLRRGRGAAGTTTPRGGPPDPVIGFRPTELRTRPGPGVGWLRPRRA